MVQKKDNETIETIFPTAKSMFEKTTEAWTALSSESILQEISKESSKGRLEAYFYKSYISEQTCKELKQQRYRVRTFMLDSAPGFKVSW